MIAKRIESSRTYSEADLNDQVEKTTLARRRAFVTIASNIGKKVAEHTGTAADHISFPNIIGTIVGVVSVPVGIGIANSQAGEVASVLMGAAGGAFIGENLRLFSNFGRTKPNEYIEDLQNKRRIISTAGLVRVFSNYDTVIPEKEVGSRILEAGLADGARRKIVDPRLLIIDKLYKRECARIIKRSHGGGPSNSPARRALKDSAFASVKVILTRVQTLAQEHRANPKQIRKEGLRLAVDILGFGVLAAAGTFFINQLANANYGAFVGALDETSILLGYVVSALWRHSENKAVTQYIPKPEPQFPAFRRQQRGLRRITNFRSNESKCITHHNIRR